jgi:hypothetical protein
METKIGKLELKSLHNEEHFEFGENVIKLVNKYSPEILGIVAKYVVYLQLFAKELEALDLVRKKLITDELPDADHKRNDTFIGLSLAVKSAGNHYNYDLKTAASHVQILFDQYNTLPSKPYDDKTVAIKNLIDELNGKYLSDITNLGLADWITELVSNNNAFIELKDTCYSKDAGKTQLQMKRMRIEVDAAYREVIEHINALITINGESVFKEFVVEMNQLITQYNAIIAIRKGH